MSPHPTPPRRRPEHPRHLVRAIAIVGLVLTIIACAVVIPGCASYAAPGPAADLQAVGVMPASIDAQTPDAIKAAMARRPMAQFPAGIAVVRVQAPGYQSLTTQGYGHGAYSVVTTREVETPEQVERMAKLPMVRGIAPVGRLMLPQTLTSDQELRQAAAQLQADMLLVYTLDTQFYVRDMAKPLTVVSLGLSPNQQARVVTTASAVLMDTRTGYVYGTAEASEHHNRLAAAWTSEDAIDAARIRTEREAFAKLIGELEKTWGMVIANHAPATQPAPEQSASAAATEIGG